MHCILPKTQCAFDGLLNLCKGVGAAGLLTFALFVGCTGDSGSTSEGNAEVDTTASLEDSQVEGRDSVKRAPEDHRSLTNAQKNRLGPGLQQLVTGDTTRKISPKIRSLEPVGERDGEDAYSVLIEGKRQSLQEADIPFVSATGNVITARLTTGQIRKAASLQGIRRIRLPSQAEAQ